MSRFSFSYHFHYSLFLTLATGLIFAFHRFRLRASNTIRVECFHWLLSTSHSIDRIDPAFNNSRTCTPVYISTLAPCLSVYHLGCRAVLADLSLIFMNNESNGSPIAYLLPINLPWIMPDSVF